MTDPATLPPLLLPSPRRLELLAGPASPARSPVRLAEDASLPPKGYTLQIDATHAPVASASSPAGHAHARRTLDQLRAQYPESLPALRIEDAPAFPTRAVMLDVSRTRVPTMPELLRRTELLASLKLNHLQLYIEHAFAYAGHERVWQGVDPITPDQLRRLDAHAGALGIELAANQNCFGHMQRWLTLPRYAHLAETHDEFSFYGIPRRGPFSLCPTDPASLDLIRDLLAQQIPCVSSGLVNIGCDETADLGQGRSRDAVSARGKLRVYADYVAQVCEIARSLSARPMLWGDIALAEPRAAGQLPEDVIALAWGYEPDSPFDAWGRTLCEAGRDWIACPGTSSWRSFTGRTRERRENLRSAARAARDHAAMGLLMTDWGDVGHRQQFPISLLAIAEGAQASWNPDAPADPRAISLHAFQDRSLRVADWLAQLGDADAQLRAGAGPRDAAGAPQPLRNASALFEHLHPSGAPTCLPSDPEPWLATLDRVSSLAQSRPQGLSAIATGQLDHTLDVARFAATLAAVERGARPPSGRGLAEQLDSLTEQHRRLWLLDSRPGGLEESTAHYLSLATRVAAHPRAG